MDFETQVLDQLSTIETKLDNVTQWQAAKQPVCDQHSDHIKTIKKIGVALITACLLAMGALIVRVVSHITPPAHSAVSEESSQP